MTTESKCPVMNGATTANGANGTKTTRARSNRDWWPNQLSLEILHQNSPLSNPMGKEFNYAKEFKQLDLDALKKDVEAVMTTSQDWWPADYGHYGIALHSHGLAQQQRLPHLRWPRRRIRHAAASAPAQQC